MTAKHRYGFAAESGARYSIRVESDFDGLTVGIRTSAERLLRAQLTCTGASWPGTRRL